MEMVLQQSGNIVSSSNTGGAAAATCRSGPRPATPAAQQEQEHAAEGAELRRGPWTVDEDLTLINYIADHGEGRWNALARAAGLKRTGKSCRLRWLNYLRPDVKRGDFTADEQLLILDLHSRWGNRWSKIAAHLPGRTDNEIKNYWRTRVQKHAKQLNCDVNSKRFKDAMRFLWMPRLAERASQQAAGGHVVNDVSCLSAAALTMATTTITTTTTATSCLLDENHSPAGSSCCNNVLAAAAAATSSSDSSLTCSPAAAHGDDWAAMQGADHEFWSSVAPAAMQLNDNAQFQDVLELGGWVQGFSEGIPDNLWSLEDIWRMY